MNRRTLLQSVLAIPAMLAGKVLASPSARKPDAMTRITEKIRTARRELPTPRRLVVTISRPILNELRLECPPILDPYAIVQVNQICDCPVYLSEGIANGFVVHSPISSSDLDSERHWKWVGE